MNTSNLYLYKNRDPDVTNFYSFLVLKSLDGIKEMFGAFFEFVIGIGNPELRQQQHLELISTSGVAISVILSDAKIANFDIN